MLVLKRKKRESVVIGEEVTVTVEEICDSDDGQCIFGATVQLGFQSPRYISIFRSELTRKSSRATYTGGTARPAQPRAGKVVEISDAQVRLRIQVPRKVPVHCSGTPSVGRDSKERLDGATHTSKEVYHVTCHKGDRVTICNNISIAAVNFHRFVPLGYPR